MYLILLVQLSFIVHKDCPVSQLQLWKILVYCNRTNLASYCRISPLLYELHWLPVRQRISFKILLFVFKAIHGFAPTYLRELVSIKRSGNYNLRSSSDSLLLATPTYRSRVTLGDRSFQVAAPALWNVLPREIRSITDLGIFKRHLKTYLFREAFY